MGGFTAESPADHYSPHLTVRPRSVEGPQPTEQLRRGKGSLARMVNSPRKISAPCTTLLRPVCEWAAPRCRQHPRHGVLQCGRVPQDPPRRHTARDARATRRRPAAVPHGLAAGGCPQCRRTAGSAGCVARCTHAQTARTARHLCRRAERWSDLSRRRSEQTRPGSARPTAHARKRAPWRPWPLCLRGLRRRGRQPALPRQGGGGQAARAARSPPPPSRRPVVVGAATAPSPSGTAVCTPQARLVAATRT